MPDGIIVELFLEKSLPECGYEYDEGMPIGEPTKLNLPRTIFFVVISLGVGIALLFAVIKLAGDGDIQIKLGVDILMLAMQNNGRKGFAMIRLHYYFLH